MKKCVVFSMLFFLLLCSLSSCKSINKKKMTADILQEKASKMKEVESEIVGGKLSSQLIRNSLYSYSYEVLLGNTSSSLLKAIKEQDFASVKKLLEKGKNVDEVDSLGNNGVFYALASSHYAILNLLLSYNINSNFANYAGKLPLFYAVDMGHLPIIMALLDGGANINANDLNGLTVAMIAVYRKRIELLRILRTKGADLTGYDANGNSLLHIAVSNDDIPTIRFLLEQGLDVYYSNYAGVRVLDLMEKSRDPQVKAIASKYKEY